MRMRIPATKTSLLSFLEVALSRNVFCLIDLQIRKFKTIRVRKGITLRRTDTVVEISSKAICIKIKLFCLFKLSHL